MTTNTELANKFQAYFNEPHERVFFSPGRVNLIGEHTDHNGGHVFPAAITQGTYGFISEREDLMVNCVSLNFPDLGIMRFSLDDLAYKEESGWINYIKGYLLYLKELGHKIEHGFNILVHGNIPNGSGLSSSASLELLVGTIADAIYNLNLETLDKVKLGQKVENDYIGVNSGIMDQFAIGFGKKEHAIYLDVNTMAYEMVPADFGDYVILIMNTNKRRELITSNYNQRRSECVAALERLQTELAIETLGELTNEEFEAHRHLINDPIFEARAKHAVSENQRTKQAKTALTQNDLSTFGQLVNESHDSLKNDYDVTGIELDTLVFEARKDEHVLGARMTGAGMGGCAIALIHKDHVDGAISRIGQAYETEIGYPASFYVAEIGDGAKEITNEYQQDQENAHVK